MHEPTSTPTRPGGAPHPGRTLDTDEVARFEALAAKWWDPEGAFRPLHQLNPVRLEYVRDRICAHFSRDPLSPPSLEGLTVLDIGCGGGLLCEPLARLGATVTGLDPSAETIAVACSHAAGEGLGIAYRAGRAEDMQAEGEQFDAVLVMEVVEHVPDVAEFLVTCASLLKPGGLMVLSTINRTLKSWALAIVGAEYVLRWLPVGTHQWERFVSPAELAAAAARAGLEVGELRGMIYNPLLDGWRLAADTDVNYLAVARAPAPSGSRQEPHAGEDQHRPA